ncbi:UPF0178 protein [Spirochaetia bacterium]|nr:UPF0178 protein [Spirochaetia bacterium]
MKIYVDADSCPRPARDIILRAAKRTGIPVIFAANRLPPGVPEGAALLCPPGNNAADDAIVARVRPGDLVVTRDIPLTARIVDAGAAVLDDRGRVCTRENIAERLSLRNFTVGLAENGLDFEWAAAYGQRERKTFADTLDRLLTRLLKPVD